MPKSSSGQTEKTSSPSSFNYIEETSRKAPQYVDITTVDITTAEPQEAPSWKLNKLKGKLRESSEDGRQAVIAELEAALIEYFDRDMEHRRAELDRMTKRADETEAQIRKRQNAREALIDLQVQAFLHEVDGLGLLSPPLQTRLAPNMNEVRVQFGTFTNEARQAPNAREDAMHQVEQARSDYATATDTDAKAKALEGLKVALPMYFDRDMEFRQSELEKVRTGLLDLQSELQKRADAKAEIVALQLKIIVNEADGLGFFSGDTSNGSSRTPYNTSRLSSGGMDRMNEASSFSGQSRSVLGPARIDELYNDHIKRLTFRLEHIPVTDKVKFGAAFREMYSGLDDYPSIYSAWGEPDTNSIVIVAPVEAEEKVREAIAIWEGEYLGIEQPDEVRNEIAPATSVVATPRTWYLLTLAGDSIEVTKKIKQVQDVVKHSSDVTPQELAMVARTGNLLMVDFFSALHPRELPTDQIQKAAVVLGAGQLSPPLKTDRGVALVYASAVLHDDLPTNTSVGSHKPETTKRQQELLMLDVKESQLTLDAAQFDLIQVQHALDRAKALQSQSPEQSPRDARIAADKIAQLERQVRRAQQEVELAELELKRATLKQKLADGTESEN